MLKILFKLCPGLLLFFSLKFLSLLLPKLSFKIPVVNNFAEIVLITCVCAESCCVKIVVQMASFALVVELC